MTRPWLVCKNVEFLCWIQGNVITQKIGFLIDIPVLLTLERSDISVRPQLTQQKSEKVRKRNNSLFGPLEIGRKTMKQKVREIGW